MTKPDWCPNDIWRDANACAVEMKVRDMVTGAANEPAHIARFLLAERNSHAPDPIRNSLTFEDGYSAALADIIQRDLQ